MKRVGRITLKIVLLLVGILLLCTGVMRIINFHRYKINCKNGIQESDYIELNGICQYVQIRGQDVDNPIIIFIHGGPASPMGYVSPYYQSGLEADYTMVNYDQRGCGRTYYANDKRNETVKVEDLEEDLNQLVDYLMERFGKQKVIIMGHSWGTVLGTRYVMKYPEKVEAYIALSQITDLYANKIDIVKQALEEGEKNHSLQEEQKEEIEHLIKRMEQVSCYENLDIADLSMAMTASANILPKGKQITLLKEVWLGMTSPYMSLSDMKWFLYQMNTDTFFEKESGLMDYAFFGFDAQEVGTEYEVPVYYIAGENDTSISQKDAEIYFEKISAPEKKFIVLENTGHSMFMDNPILFDETVKQVLD